MGASKAGVRIIKCLMWLDQQRENSFGILTEAPDLSAVSRLTWSEGEISSFKGGIEGFHVSPCLGVSE